MRTGRIRWAATACVLVGLGGCSNIPPTDAGYLGDPVALSLVNDPVLKRNVLFIANADGNDLRVFLPDTHLFERAPNGISPLIVPLALYDASGNVTFPSFRPTHIATGAVAGTCGASPCTRAYAIVGGAAERVGVVDAATLLSTQAATDQMHCAAGVQDVSCLGAEALNVATTGAGAFALLAPDATGIQHIVAFTPGVENSQAVLTLNAAATVALPAGTFTSLAVVVTDAFVGDRSSPRVLDVPLGGGAPVPIATDGPVKSVVPSPAFVDAAGTSHAAGELVFAILVDGRVNVLNVASHAIATYTAIVNSVPTTKPQVPFAFSTAVQAITFVPCNEPGQTPPIPCQLRTDAATLRVAPEVAALGFAGLADGTTVPLVPDQTQPQVWHTVNVSIVGTALSIAPQPLSVQSTTLTVDMLTPGVTRDEAFSLIYDAPLPGLSGRTATITSGMLGATITLTDPTADFSHVLPGDIIFLSTNSGPCMAFNGLHYLVTTAPGTSTTISGTVIGDAPAACAQSEVGYLVGAISSEAPWVLTSNLTGFVTRLAGGTVTEVTAPGLCGATCPPATGTMMMGQSCSTDCDCAAGLLCNTAALMGGVVTMTCGAPMCTMPTAGMAGATCATNCDCAAGLSCQTSYSMTGARFYYPPSPITDGPALRLALSATPPSPGGGFTFSTQSGVLPFVVSDPTLSAAGSGFAVSLAALANSTGSFLYIAVPGGNDLTEANLAFLTEANSITDFH